MKRRPPRQPTAQQMIRAYLGQVSTAATRKLPKGDRLLFVGRTRAAIEAQVGPLASASDADAVAAALTALGDPEELAAKELERLYSKGRGAAAPPALWKPPGKAGRRETPPPAAKPARSRPASPQPRKPRPWPYRRSGHDEPALPPPAVPGTAGAPGSAPPGAVAGPGAPSGAAGPATSSGAAGPGAPSGAAGSGAPPGAAEAGTPSGAVGSGAPYGAVEPGARYGVVGPGMPPYGTGGPAAHNGSATLGTGNGSGPGGLNGSAPAAPAGDTAPGPAEGPAESGTRPFATQPGAPPGATAGADEPGPASLPGATPPDGTAPLSIVPGMNMPSEAEDEPAGRRFGPPVPLTEAWALARKHPLEAVAVVVLGVGGLIYPFPLWLIGGVVALFSRRWGKREKWLALAGPPVFAGICMLLLGMTGGGNFFHALAAASHQFGLLLRVGCVLCAGYLVWRLRRGPRRRKLPPWQRVR